MLTTGYAISTGAGVVVGVQGTVFTELESWLNNAMIEQLPVTTEWFPGRPEDVRVHSGFLNGFESMIARLAQAVRGGLADNGNKVLVVGHSKGAAVAQLVAVSLQQTLAGATVTGRFFASPRVGNPAWANYADSVLGSRAWHITNNNDIVADVPTQTNPLNEDKFRHMSGEVWITPDGRYVLCEGQENPKCANSIPFGSKKAGRDPHNGPYMKVMMADCNK